ncbi:hypothetical protein COC42_04955 [Sphingomonas spermidinifaciens]|uniref:Uncharacterized protein n=2 Tax=Sphingomonas spermidinifaciens TaxID=1141889 RepID=A0A2A4B7T5_9SPHN|nr:hypothetical protein COC42_04955 [Sphingomonas spermidinifaciens]
MNRRATLTALALLAVAIPAAALGPRLIWRPDGMTTPPEPVAWNAPPPLSAALDRPLFDAAEAEPPADAPELVGIVGRLDRDAVAMVRGQDGGVRTLRPGEGVDGWQLRSLAIDAAYFTRGTQSARVTLAD